MIPSITKSMADLIVQSEFKLLHSLYLGELQQIAHGIPCGIVRLAEGLHGGKYDRLLHDAASFPAYLQWQNRIGMRIAGESYVSRASLLGVADEANVARKYRRATQLYGWLLLTSRSDDNEKQWSLHHLQQIRSQHYALSTRSQ